MNVDNSVVSASFGVTKFLKCGPMTLVPRNHFGLSFLFAMVVVGGSLIGKAILLLNLLREFGFEGTGVIIQCVVVWAGCCLIPHLMYVSMYLLLT